MSGIKQKLAHEARALTIATVYFGAWIAMLVALKQLVLAEYHIPFRGVMAAVMGTLILSKVVLLLEPVSLGAWVRAHPAWVNVVLRTVLYGLGVLAVLILEKSLDRRHEYGGFWRSFTTLFQHPDMDHIWANSIALLAALLGYNVITVVRSHLGDRSMLRLFILPIPEKPTAGHASTQPAQSASAD